MPQIKQYTRKVLPNELVNVQASAASFGGDVSGLQAQARGQQQMANALGELEASVNTIIKKREESDYYAKVSEFELQNMKRSEELATGEFEDETQITRYYEEDLNQRAEALDIPRSMQDRWQRDLANMRMNFVGSGMKEQSRRAGVKAKMNYENTLTNVTNMVQLDSSKFEEGSLLLENQINSLNVPDVDKAAMIDSMRDGLRSTALTSEAQKNPYQFKKDALAGKYNDVENLAQIIGLSERKIKEIEGEAKARAGKEKGLKESRIDLDLAMAKSVDDLVLIENNLKLLEKSYGEEWANDYRVKLVKFEASMNKKKDDVFTGSMFVSGDATINPKLKEHRDSADEYYKSMISTPEFLEQDEQGRNFTITQMLSKTRYVPQTLQGEVLAAARSNDKEKVLQAVNLLDNIRVQSPQLLTQFEGTERLDLVNFEYGRGVPFKDAIEKVDKMLDPTNKPSVDQTKMELSEILKSKDMRDEVVNTFSTTGDWFSSFLGGGISQDNKVTKEQVDFAAADYRAAYEKAYTLTRDESAAAELAKKELQFYGRTEVNNRPMITKYPIEQFYQIENQDSAWIREQALEDVVEFYGEGMSVSGGKSFIKDNLYIVPHNKRTAETAKTGKPEYKLMLIENDVPIDILGEGVYWQPDEAKERAALVKGKPIKEGSGELRTLLEALD